MMSSFTSNQIVTSMPDRQLKYRLYNYSDPSTDISGSGTGMLALGGSTVILSL